MTRFTQFALILFVAIAAFSALVKADPMLDESGKEIVVFDSKVGDADFENDVTQKRALNIRGKRTFGMDTQAEALFSSAPGTQDKLRGDNLKITWYGAHDLLNPACGDEKWNPTDASHIGAVHKNWNKGPQCGDFVRICNPKVHRCVKVRVVDECAGCSSNHIDLTKSAFKKLATTGSLDEGITTGLKMYTCSKPNPWDLSLFGPLKLRD